MCLHWGRQDIYANSQTLHVHVDKLISYNSIVDYEGLSMLLQPQLVHLLQN